MREVGQPRVKWDSIMGGVRQSREKFEVLWEKWDSTMREVYRRSGTVLWEKWDSTMGEVGQY